MGGALSETVAWPAKMAQRSVAAGCLLPFHRRPTYRRPPPPPPSLPLPTLPFLHRMPSPCCTSPLSPPVQHLMPEFEGLSCDVVAVSGDTRGKACSFVRHLNAAPLCLLRPLCSAVGDAFSRLSLPFPHSHTRLPCRLQALPLPPTHSLLPSTGGRPAGRRAGRQPRHPCGAHRLQGKRCCTPDDCLLRKSGERAPFPSRLPPRDLMLLPLPALMRMHRYLW